MGHASIDTMIKATKPGGCWSGFDITEADLRSVFRDYQCLICKLAKTKMLAPMVREHGRDLQPGEMISCDISPSSITSREGYTMSFIFCDQKTGYLHIFGSKSKTDFLKFLVEVYSWYKSYRCLMQVLLSDDENVLKSVEVIKWLREHHIEKESSNPYQHWQNAVENCGVTS